MTRAGSEMDHASRQRKLTDALRERGIDLAFCLLPSGDLEYLTGFPRRNASFGNFEYTHQWAAGAFFRPDADPVYVVPQGYAAFNLPGGVAGDVVHLRNVDDADAIVGDLVRGFGRVDRLAVSARTFGATVVRLRRFAPGAELIDLDELVNPMRRVKSPGELAALTSASRICDVVMGEITKAIRVGVTELEIACEVDFLMRKHGGRTPSFDTGVFAMGPGDDRDASTRVSARALHEGLGLSFDFGCVVDGYCSDFGRTVHLGAPTARFTEVYEVVIAAQAAGARAAVPGNTFADVDRATRAVISEAGYGQWFRHRTGHCIGVDTHERPFVSEEDHTVLVEGMTFTIEPSVFWPGTVGARVEDIFVCRPGGAVSLNDYPYTLVAV